MISVTRGVLFSAGLLSGSILLTGCLGDDCRYPRHRAETWTRDLNVVETHSLYQDTARSDDTSSTRVNYSGYFSVFHDYPGERDHSVVTTVPRMINITFLSEYARAAMESWRRQGFFIDTSADTGAYVRGYLYHEITLDPDSLSQGTYAFNLADTAGPVRVRLHLYVSGSETSRHDSLAMTGFSGSITITEAFTKNSGKFSYSAVAEYRPGQKSTFAGTVSFDGVVHEEFCESEGVP